MIQEGLAANGFSIFFLPFWLWRIFQEGTGRWPVFSFVFGRMQPDGAICR
ncbi:hypothetical protein Hsw_0257 [Hymenobacter swuensis DY53]|uniref:Uncharacterized protein n=1 Tax=Hymenobacter swuensis DY53 TaxID=1227739 RepID=W8EVU3_9BACT|nr:hypothetical protein Hsw_0257 [Hymenobacter swuensis DY53]